MNESTQLLNQSNEDELLLQSLRAASWDEFYGQEQLKTALQISLQAAKKRAEVLDHTLFYGPPGLGKTTLSHLIAKEMNAQIKITSGTAIAKAGDLAAILTNLESGSVLFIDEIHRLPKVVEETLYPAMEDFALDIIVGKGPSARTLRIDLPRFTLVGATTRFGALASPFRDRFGVTHRLEYYAPEALSIIIQKAGQKLLVSIDEAACIEIALRSRGTPRIALKLLKRVRDYVQMKDLNHVSKDLVKMALDMFSIDTVGLDHQDRSFLETLIHKFGGGPVGLSTLSASLSEESGTIEEVLEPYLLQIGFIERTSRGRTATKKAYQHLGIKHLYKEVHNTQ